jgi:hypothetical protein
MAKQAIQTSEQVVACTKPSAVSFTLFKRASQPRLEQRNRSKLIHYRLRACRSNYKNPNDVLLNSRLEII